MFITSDQIAFDSQLKQMFVGLNAAAFEDNNQDSNRRGFMPFSVRQSVARPNQEQINFIGQIQNATELQTELNFDEIRKRQNSGKQEQERIRSRSFVNGQKSKSPTHRSSLIDDKVDQSLFQSQIYVSSGMNGKELQQIMSYDGYIDFQAQLSL